MTWLLARGHGAECPVCRHGGHTPPCCWEAPLDRCAAGPPVPGMQYDAITLEVVGGTCQVAASVLQDVLGEIYVLCFCALGCLWKVEYGGGFRCGPKARQGGGLQRCARGAWWPSLTAPPPPTPRAGPPGELARQLANSDARAGARDKVSRLHALLRAYKGPVLMQLAANRPPRVLRFLK